MKSKLAGALGGVCVCGGVGWKDAYKKGGFLTSTYKSVVYFFVKKGSSVCGSVVKGIGLIITQKKKNSLFLGGIFVKNTPCDAKKIAIVTAFLHGAIISRPSLLCTGEIRIFFFLINCWSSVVASVCVATVFVQISTVQFFLVVPSTLTLLPLKKKKKIFFFRKIVGIV